MTWNVNKTLCARCLVVVFFIFIYRLTLKCRRTSDVDAISQRIHTTKPNSARCITLGPLSSIQWKQKNGNTPKRNIFHKVILFVVLRPFDEALAILGTFSMLKCIVYAWHVPFHEPVTCDIILAFNVSVYSKWTKERFLF